jgi:hypothetical protein
MKACKFLPPSLRATFFMDYLVVNYGLFLYFAENIYEGRPESKDRLVIKK